VESWLRPAAVALIVALIAESVEAGEGWYLEYEDGQAAAKAQGKDLLLDFGGSDWCVACKWLKERVLSKSEFIDLASHKFVLVDIDLLYRTPLPADRKKRYEQLQERYGIASVPTVVLALSDGRPYVRTTYREAFQTPKAYWDYLAPSSSTSRMLTTGRVERHSVRGSGPGTRSASGTPALFCARPRDLKARLAPGHWPRAWKGHSSPAGRFARSSRR
jgi:thiol-disulfide isomerase/thioredoxin